MKKPDEFKKCLGNRLKKVREAMEYSQKDMAEAIQTNTRTWQIYEAGKSVPGGKSIERLVHLGIDANWLLTGKGSMMRERGKTMSTESELLEVCQEIGFISKCNCHFTDGLVGVIERSGKNIQEMTIAELLTMTRNHSAFYNKMYDQAA
jgi:transcriptional regulator with XRE-family HTH domain